MCFEEIAGEESNVDVSQFWRGLGVWLCNPHVVNRRILAAVKILTAEVQQEALTVIEKGDLLYPLSQLAEHSAEEAESLLNTLNIAQYCHVIDSVNPLETSDKKLYLCVKKLLPRNPEIFCPTLELTFIDKRNNCITSFHLPSATDKQSLAPKAYSISYNKGTVSINVKQTDSHGSSSEWLKHKLLPRLIKWMQNDTGSSTKVNSLSLVSPERYAKLYDELKRKYAEGIVKIWPENTDPLKFVYEDIAIATYLLLLWEKERREKGTEKLQSFLDLGCGNGLLVHILSSEGHEGIGIDLRKRKIWDLFSARLEVRTIIPSSKSLFPDVDWIIGNHSDELTPWIPVISARSSYNCRFFLLPCCAYEFNGNKYRRRDTSRSQYAEYIDYVKKICENCGFLTEIDRLRIPSTKRICLVGWKRMYPKEDAEKQDKCIENMIGAKSSDTANKENEAEKWACDFKPREVVEKARNCTQLDRSLVSDIVGIVTSHLLHQGERIPLEERRNATWNAGREIELNEIVELIPSSMLGQLRNECGGLQTLLRNHGHIFNVSRGKVRFRIPGSDVTPKKRRSNICTRKTKPCWFYHNHPDGCPTTDAKCNFKH